MASFHSLRSRLLLPLSGLLIVCVLFGTFGMYSFTNSTLMKDLHIKAELISSPLLISAETSSSINDFRRSFLAISAEPSVESIILLNRDYQPTFHDSNFSDDILQSEREELQALGQQALSTGLSVGEPSHHNSNIYQLVSPIYITARAQDNALQVEVSLLLVRLHTEQAKGEALNDALRFAMLFLFLGLVTFLVIYYLINQLVLKPSKRIITVMNAQRLNQDEMTNFAPINELGKIGQTLDALSLTLRTREQALKMALTEAQDSNKELSIAATIFESEEGMMVTDSRNVILRVNRAFTEITGYSQEDAIGQTPELLSSSGLQDKAFYERVWDSINTAGLWKGEAWSKRKSGEIYPEYITITAVKDTAGITTNYVSTHTDITTRKAAEDEIKNLAFYDALTELPNRRLLFDRLNQSIAATARSGLSGALLFLDLDYFKTLNDTMGHDVGDILLQQVATRLITCVREGDSVARIGGDEFVVLLENLSPQAIVAAEQARVIAGKILLTLNKPYKFNMQTYQSSCSIGATLFSGHEKKIEELLKQSDIAMYQSKTAGRNTLRFFDPLMQESLNARVGMENELRKAIEHHQFQLYYQIQVDSNGHASGAEALIRWIHPSHGIISPFKFIPLAEETGLISPIGQWVMDTACGQLKLWQQNPLAKNLILAINISAKQFHQKDFVILVKSTLLRHGINPERLKLELTESMLVENINDIILKMEALSKFGIQFSLDDFGTGFSSLQYLKKLPLDQLKIDQSFVRDLVTDNSDRAIIRTIISIAHSLGINVIAEGVETEEQRQFLLDNGCTYYQGYLFSKPLPIDEFEACLGKVKFGRTTTSE